MIEEILRQFNPWWVGKFTSVGIRRSGYLNKIDKALEIQNFYIETFLNALQADYRVHYLGSVKNKKEKRERERARKRTYYEERKKKNEPHIKVNPIGPRKGKDKYENLSDEDKWERTQKQMKLSEVRAGDRCFICGKLFSDEEVEGIEEGEPHENRIPYTKVPRGQTEPVTLYYHMLCKESGVQPMNTSNDDKAEDH